MAETLQDLLTLSGGRRLAQLLTAKGDRYKHLIHVGAGWAFARLHREPWGSIRCGEPLLRWLAWDGWGFHQAFFRSDRVFAGHWVERSARGAVRSIRDQGAGRALWFYAGADPHRIAAVIVGFPPDRRADLWAGIGLAAGYTGAQQIEALRDLARAADGYLDHLGQGAAFAAKAHVLSGAVPPPVASAVEALTGVTSVQAAAWTDAALASVANRPDDVATYQEWRARIRAAVNAQRGGVCI